MSSKLSSHVVEQIRQQVHQMFTQLYPSHSEALKALPEGVDRQEWFDQLVEEKRQEWKNLQARYAAYGQTEKANKEKIKLAQLEKTVEALRSC